MTSGRWSGAVIALFWDGGEVWVARGAVDAGVAGVAGSSDRGLWPGGLRVRVGGRPPAVSAGRARERLELLECGEEFGRPRPCVLQVELAAARGEREPGGDVEQAVADAFGFGLGEFPVEEECLGPDDPVVRERDDLEPYLVERERLERELGQAGVLVVTDPVLDVGVLAVAALHDGDLRVGLVGEDRLEAVAVVVGERRVPPGWGRSRRTISRQPAGQADRSTMSVISETSPLFALAAQSLVEFRAGRSSGIMRIAARTCSVSS